MASGGKYAYAVARVRVLETKLLEKGQLDRMVEAKGPQEALQVLGETVYGPAVAELEGVHEYEALLERELTNLYQLVRSFYPDPELVELFALKYDVHNLKVLFKADMAGEQLGNVLDLFIGAGSMPAENLINMFQEEDFRALPPALAEAAVGLKEELAQNPDPQVVDLVLDQALYSQLALVAKKLSFLQRFFTYQTDLVNIKVFLRVRNLGRDWGFLQRVLLPGGSLQRDFFREHLEESLDSFSDRLAMGAYGAVVEEGIREWQEKKNLTRYEKLSDDFLLNYLRQEKHNPFGPEPLVGYLLAKENELKLIRIIMVGKLNKLPTEAIRERLRDVYV